MEFSVNDFDSLNTHLKNEDSIVFIKGRNCGVCDVMYPLIKNIADKYNVNIIKVYIEDFKELSGQYMVFTIPTVLVFNYDKEMLRESKFINQNKLENYFEKKSKICDKRRG
ncbi:thioredoxin family protein [Mycoplasmatota bacterium WC44]